MESAPQHEQSETESTGLEYTIDPSSYKHLGEQAAKLLALENGLESHTIKREGQFLGDPVGYNPRRLVFTVLNGDVISARIG